MGIGYCLLARASAQGVMKPQKPNGTCKTRLPYGRPRSLNSSFAQHRLPTLKPKQPLAVRHARLFYGSIVEAEHTCSIEADLDLGFQPYASTATLHSPCGQQQKMGQ